MGTIEKQKNDSIISDDRANQISGAVFMIGLALLFFSDWWFPGIFFVIGASSIAQSIVEGRRWYAGQSGIFMIGLGTIFWIGFNPAYLFLIIGAMMLFGWWDDSDSSPDFGRKKKKNDEIH